MLYPVGIHFLISEGLAFVIINLLLSLGMIEKASVSSYLIELTGIANLLILMPGIYFYLRDRARDCAGLYFRDDTGKIVRLNDRVWKNKKLHYIEFPILFLTGGGIAILTNIMVNMLNVLYFHDATYSDNMGKMIMGKSIWILILWVGIVAPFAEEVIFRWLVYRRLQEYVRIPFAMIISSFMFGAYHGNLLQFLYATLLGMIFAVLYEKTHNKWTPVMLHMGANTTALILSDSDILFLLGEERISQLMMLLILFAALGSVWFFTFRSKNRFDGES